MSATPIVPEVPRRRRRTALLGIVVIAGLLLAACGSDDDSVVGRLRVSRRPRPPMGAVEDGAYPVSIDHKYGTTELTEKPERVVTVGLTDQDAVLALGTKPVGVTEWFGEQPLRRVALGEEVPRRRGASRPRGPVRQPGVREDRVRCDPM